MPKKDKTQYQTHGSDRVDGAEEQVKDIYISYVEYVHLIHRCNFQAESTKETLPIKTLLVALCLLLRSLRRANTYLLERLHAATRHGASSPSRSRDIRLYPPGSARQAVTCHITLVTATWRARRTRLHSQVYNLDFCHLCRSQRCRIFFKLVGIFAHARVRWRESIL